MPVREQLNNIRWIEKIIESNLLELEHLRGLMYRLQSMSTDTKVHTSKRPEANFVAIVEKIEETEEKINDHIDRLTDAKEEIREKIERLEHSDEKLCLHLRYLNFMDWHGIADKMGLSERQVHRVHDKAILNMEKKTQISL